MIKNLIYSLVSGLLLGLTWPEITNFPALIFVAFVPVFFLAKNHKNSPWQALFLWTFLSFFIWHLIAVYWMVYSSYLAAITAWIINSFLMAMVFTSAFYSHKLLKRIPFILFLIAYWLGFEIFHLFWDLKWPWMTLGHVFANKTHWIQWYEYTGVYGGSIWVLLINYLIFKSLNKQEKPFYRILIFSFTAILLLLPIWWAHNLLNKTSVGSKSLNISVLQPNIDTYTEKFNGLSDLQQSEKIIQLLENTPSNSDLILLPETVINTNFDSAIKDYPPAIELLLNWSHKNKTDIIGGFYTKDSLYNYNSALYIHQGEIVQNRHKIKLLAFGEKLPFSYILQFFENYIQQNGGAIKSYGKDKDAKVFTLSPSKNDTLGSLICFESAFVDISTQMVRNGAQILLIITNDDWWKDTPGYRQHFAYARVRAIENRRPIARSANTGISGFIDAYGNILEQSQYKTETLLTTTICYGYPLTFFSKKEPIIRYLLASMAILLGLMSIIKSLWDNKKSRKWSKK